VERLISLVTPKAESGESALDVRGRVTACLIVQNEQDRLPAALDSVAFCDEIVVVDGGSTDRTIEIARTAGARVIENPWPGYARQRNVAIDAATGEWILEVDADERVSPTLRGSIEELLTRQPDGPAIAVCALRNRFLGGLLGPSAKYPAYRSRLFRRGSYRHDQSRSVHEGLDRAERPVILDGDLEHELAGTMREALADMWSYTRLDSGHVPRPVTPGAYLVGIVLRPLSKVIYRTVIDRGWQDGWRGLLKIWLDAASDALVWMRVLIGTRAGTPTTSTDSITTAHHNHFGRRGTSLPKVVALAARGEPTRKATGWLEKLYAEGVDVTLISEQPIAGTALPTQTVRRLRPVAVMRVLDLEMQIQAIQAVVPFGRRARLISHLLPRSLRPSVSGLEPESDPEWAISAIRDSIPPT
jgi:glycosyltransferase involved in cell wall biosynthesis